MRSGCTWVPGGGGARVSHARRPCARARGAGGERGVIGLRRGNSPGVGGAVLRRSAGPWEVHLPSPPEDCELLEAWLSERSGRRVQVLVPKRGEKRGLVELANRNARVAYQARLIDTGLSQYDALETLRAILALPAIPRRIECFDISTIQGSETVASMV